MTLDEYRRKGYVVGSGRRSKALDAAVSLTACNGDIPAFSTDPVTGVDWWHEAYECASVAVENAIVDVLVRESLEEDIAVAAGAARLVREVTIGPGYFDPVFPYHGAIRICPFCSEPYRVHGGFADHRDECEEGPFQGANPIGADEVEP